MTQALKWYTIPVEKLAWGEGPWKEEPDKMQYADEDTGYPCLIVRNRRSGNLCGYVGVPPEHIWHGKNYSDTVPIPEGFMDRKMDDRTAMIPLICNSANVAKGKVSIDLALDVHGGITFSDEYRESDSGDPSTGIYYLPEEDEEVDIWWFGFDCAHAGDLSPGMMYHMPAFLGLEEGVYRTVEYVQKEIQGLAKQLAAIQAVGPLLLTHEAPTG